MMTKRHGREWCGAGARHAASTSASSTSRGDRLGAERADRAARLEERGHRGVTGTGPRAAGGRARGTSRRGTTSRSRPRTIATGTPAALPITSSAADAISSAIATSVTCRIAAERVGRVAQVDDGRDPAHADRDVGEPVPPRPAERVGDDDRDVDAGRARAARRGCAWPSGRGRRGAARPSPSSTFERSMPAFAHTKPCARLADDEVAAPAHDAHRLRLDERAAARRGRRGRAATSRPSAFDTIFCVTTRQSPSASGVPCRGGRVGDRVRELVAGPDLADARRSG